MSRLSTNHLTGVGQALAEEANIVCRVGTGKNFDPVVRTSSEHAPLHHVELYGMPDARTYLDGIREGLRLAGRIK